MRNRDNSYEETNMQINVKK